MLLCVLLTMPGVLTWAQQANDKFAWTTQMFLDELKTQAEQPATPGPRRTPRIPLPEGERMPKPQRIIASPDTVGGVAYISCFIHLKDVGDLGAVRSLGIEVEETFDGLDFVTARVPVSQLEALAAIDNVTNIKVAQLMHPMTDVARQKTNVDDVLTLSADASALGVNTTFDGTGVVLGILDTGIDFQHIAFKDKDGNSRIKRAYVYDGSTAKEYDITSSAPTTDDSTQDHGTHTASTAGGSSVIVSGSSVTVTDDHARATYGGMAPGADLYLAGVNSLYSTYLMDALKRVVQYADAEGKPLVVSNSWGSGYGPHDGTDEWAEVVSQYFGENHPGRIILFAAGNNAGRSKDDEGGGFFAKKGNASSSNPLGTIMRSNTLSYTDAGYYYYSNLSIAWSASPLICKVHVLNSSTGSILKSWTVTSSTSSFSGLNSYYDGSLGVYISRLNSNGKYSLKVYSGDGLEAKDFTKMTKNGENYYKSNYTLAIEVYPSTGTANVDLWAQGYTYFTNHLSTSGHNWMAGTDDMCVSDQATIPDAISVGAYVSKSSWTDYTNKKWPTDYTVGDIAPFSSYATAEQSPTGLAYPWITAPGARIAAGVNHYHTTAVDNGSYYGTSDLVVNSSHSPYGMMQGTSMATPVAAGIVALWLQAARTVGKDLTVGEVKDIMAQTAINDSYTTTGPNASRFGHGKIDALAGLHYILGNYSENVAVEAVTLNHTAVAMNVGGTLQLEATIAPANATNKSVSWATTVGGVVSVSESGLVTAVAAGTTIVSCTANDGSGATAACEVTVMPNDKYPVPYFVSVTCKNEKPLELTNDDVLRMEAVFGNRGIAGNVVTLPVVLTNDGSLMIVEEGEELSRMFPAGENTTVGHSLSLANVPEGDYYATVLLYKESDDEEETGWYYSSRCLVDIHVSAGSLKGDVNGDGEVNGTDLVVLANIILDRSENRPAADVNGDGEVNGTDLVVLVNIVLERDASRMAADISTGHFSTSTTLQLNSLDIAAGETKELTVSLQNPGDALTLLQFDLTLPEGLSIQKIAGDYQADMAGRTSSNSHQLSVQAGGTSLRFLLASPVNALIAGTEGAVVRMAVTASHGFAGGTISLHNILGVSPDEQEVRMSAVQYDMADSTTGIYSMTDRQIVPTVYNLHGQRMAKLKSGINIMDGKKLFKK